MGTTGTATTISTIESNNWSRCCVKPFVTDAKFFIENGTKLVNQEELNHLIDCDADPLVPRDWKVHFHRRRGMLGWNPQKIKLFFAPEQTGSSTIEGLELFKRLRTERVLNANVLDYLLQHRELIPEEWKDYTVYFWGTVYIRCGELVVRCLFWNGFNWLEDFDTLDLSWNDEEPTVIYQP